jgi:hypothetical protein
MAPVLTVHDGEAQASFTEHPTEAARKALMAAAVVETPALASALRRVAMSLPRRAAIARLEAPDLDRGPIRKVGA